MRRPDRLDYEAAPVSSSTALRLNTDHWTESTGGRPPRRRSRLVLAATLIAVLLIAVALIAVATLVATALFHGSDDMDYTIDYDEPLEPTAAASNLTASEVAKKRELLQSARNVLDKYYRINNGMKQIGPFASGRMINPVRSTTTTTKQPVN